MIRIARSIRLPELPDHPGNALLGAVRRILAWRPDDPVLLLWRIVWLPFWLGGDLPVPWLPEREITAQPDSPAALGAARAIDRIGRRVWINWIIAALARGLWLPFVAGAIAGLIHLIRGTPFLPETLLWLWFVTLPLGLVFGLLMRPGRRRIAWMLDHTFTLHDRMTTAVEALETGAPAPGTQASMAYLQLADTANAAIGLRGDPRFRIHLPAREISLAILSGLLLASLLFLRGVGGEIPAPAQTTVPVFVPAAERRTVAEIPQPSERDAERPPTVQEVQQRSEISNATREDLNAIAAALDQNALTAPAAEAMRNGDYAAAAELIRAAAEQAGELSPEARADLANALDQASQQARDSSPSLSEAAHQAASGLREGGDAARSGLRNLGDAVDLASDAVIPQEELAAQLEEAQQAAQQQRAVDAAPYQQTGGGQGSRGQPEAGDAGEQGGAQRARTNTDSSGADARPGFGAESSAGQTDQASTDNPSGQNGGNSDVAAGAVIGDGSVDQSAAGSDSAGSESGSDQPGSGGDAAESAGNAPGGQQQTSGQPGGTGAGGESFTPGQESDDTQRSATGAKSERIPTPAPTQISQTSGAGSKPGAQPTVVSSGSINLPGQSQGGETISLGGNQGSASWANGAGVTEAHGEATQAPVPTAGPDRNRVPPDYRTVVENYFNRGTP